MREGAINVSTGSALLSAPTPVIVPPGLNDDFARTRYVAYTPTYWTPFDKDRAADIRADLVLLRETWNGLITYGAYGALAEVPGIAKEVGFERMILGVYNLHDEEDIGNACRLIERYPELIRSVCLGNEGLAFKLYDVEKLVATIREFRRRFPGIWITTSEPIFSWGERAFVEEVDFCAPIIHPWIHEIFKSEPTTAAMWTIQAAQRLHLLSGKMVLIKETGFPSDGERYPHEPQRAFWEVLLREAGAFTQNVHLAVFEAFDIPGKIAFAARTDWDTCWGIFDSDRNPKPAARAIFDHYRPRYAGSMSREESESVGVVIAAKDRPQYLAQAVESALEQAAVRQVVLVNDNSRLGEVETICRRYLSDPRVKYVGRTTPGSSGTARNAGLRELETPLACFLDDDDAFLPGKIEVQLDALRRAPRNSFVGTSAMVVDQEGNYCGRFGNPDFFPGAPLAGMLAFCRVVHSSVLMPTAVVREAGGYLEHFEGEDWELWCRLVGRGHSLVYVDEPLTLYRRHPSNISSASYVRNAVRNVLAVHLKDSRQLLAPLAYDPASGEVLKASIQVAHGRYEEALESLGGNELPVSSIARHICWRELGEYSRAASEIATWTAKENLTEALRLRLSAHERKFKNRRHNAIVGSPALLVEQRLLAQDAFAASQSSAHRPGLGRYFHQNPKHINIEYDDIDGDDDIFFRRVSLTSC